jgi:hypothetical protein
MLPEYRDTRRAVQAGERRYASMHARMSTLEGSPEAMDEGLRDVREHVLPLLKQQEGF